jgi:hypothetical protein
MRRNAGTSARARQQSYSIDAAEISQVSWNTVFYHLDQEVLNRFAYEIAETARRLASVEVDIHLTQLDIVAADLSPDQHRHMASLIEKRFSKLGSVFQFQADKFVIFCFGPDCKMQIEQRLENLLRDFAAGDCCAGASRELTSLICYRQLTVQTTHVVEPLLLLKDLADQQIQKLANKAA